MRIAPRGALNYNLNELMRMIGRFERPDFRWRDIPEQNPLYDIGPPKSYEGIPEMGMDRDPFTLMQELESGDYPRPTAEDYYAQQVEAGRRRVAEIEAQLAALSGEKAAAGLPAAAPSAAVPQDVAVATPPGVPPQRDMGGIMPGFSVTPDQVARIRAEAPAVIAALMENRNKGVVPRGPIGGGAFPETMPQSSGNAYRDEAIRRLASVPTREEYDFTGPRPTASPTGVYTGQGAPLRRLAAGEMGPPSPMTGSMRIYDIPEADMQQIGQLQALAGAEDRIQDAQRQYELDKAVKLGPHFVTAADERGQRVVGFDPVTGRRVMTEEIGGPQPQRGVVNEIWSIAMAQAGGGKPWAQMSEGERQLANQQFQQLLLAYRGQASAMGGTGMEIGPPDPNAIARGAQRTS